MSTEAETATPRWQVGTWTLTAPDGRTWQADSPLKCCGAEQRERIPHDVAIKRIFAACDESEVAQERAAPLEGVSLRESADRLAQAGHDFWTACRKDAGGGAVRWLDLSDGTLIIFTRLEYKQQLLAVVDKIPGIPELYFEEDGGDEGVSIAAVGKVAPASPQPLAPPPGNALVPLEPTPAMCRAYLSAVGRHTPYSASDPAISDGYRAMVAAAPQPPASALPLAVGVEPEAIARKFHEAYERLAPSFGYETRPETRAFDPESPNGQLMIAVCRELAASPPPPGGMVPMTEPEEWDFWDVVGLHCAGYNSAIDSDLINVFIESATDGRWYADIAKRLGLQEHYIELLKEILCSADFCEYGTSPRGAWAIDATFADNLAKLKAWYLGKWNQEFTPEGGIKEGS